MLSCPAQYASGTPSIEYGCDFGQCRLSVTTDNSNQTPLVVGHCVVYGGWSYVPLVIPITQMTP